MTFYSCSQLPVCAFIFLLSVLIVSWTTGVYHSTLQIYKYAFMCCNDNLPQISSTSVDVSLSRRSSKEQTQQTAFVVSSAATSRACVEHICVLHRQLFWFRPVIAKLWRQGPVTPRGLTALQFQTHWRLWPNYCTLEQWSNVFLLYKLSGILGSQHWGVVANV